MARFTILTACRQPHNRLSTYRPSFIRELAATLWVPGADPWSFSLLLDLAALAIQPYL